MTLTFDDPLRRVREAVHTGRFRDARAELGCVDEGARTAPEGQLLTAMADWRLGDFASSRALALQARDRFRGRGDADGEMRAENVAAAGAFALGELREAERGFSRALALAHELADDLVVARCANNLGNVAYYLAHHETALSFYRLARANFEKLAFWHGLAESWLNSTLVLYDAGDLEGSREAGERAVHAAERADDARILGQALAARSETDAALGDLALAHVLAERAHALATEHDHVVGQADALRVLALIAWRTGDAEQAVALGHRALVIAERVDDPWRKAEVRRDLGEIYASVGRSADAAAAFAEAAQAFGRLGADTRAVRMRERLTTL